jgi:hypothetical protein
MHLRIALAVTLAAAVCWSAVTSPESQALAATPSVKGKVYAGYQGWFTAAGDGSPINNWTHWSRGSKPSPGNQTFEVYPDMRQYPANTKFQTGYANLGNGQPATLFSSFPASVVDLHFSWMQRYGIDGAALQRFTSDVSTPGSPRNNQRNSITLKARDAAQKYGRGLYIEYDLSGMTDNLAQAIKNDWTNTVKGSMHLPDSPAYARESGKPVVELWGFGVVGSSPNIGPSLDLVNWFKSQGTYVIGGVPRGWRTDSNTKPGFGPVYQAVNMISPWNVGSAAVNNDLYVADRDALRKTGQDYQPVIFPGFAWSNWNGGARNLIPRKAGDFLWQQAGALRRNGIPQAFIAMFDEYDEGTAIAPLAEDSSMIPTNQYFLTASADGTFLSSDFYLRLAGAATRMINGTDPLTTKVPIPPTTGPVAFRTSFEPGLDAMPKNATTFDIASGTDHERGQSALHVQGSSEAFDVAIPVTATTKLTYSLLAKDEASRDVTVNLVLTDGTTWRDTSSQGTVGTWTRIQSSVPLAGKTISKIVVAQPNAGGANAFIDDIEISN